MNTKTTNNTHLMLLQRVAEVGQRSLVDALQRDPSYVSRFFSGKSGLHINELEHVFSTLGLRVIQCEGETVTLDKEEYEALRVLAKKGI